MCGITGWFDTRGERPADRALISKMTHALAHRGPDGQGLHFAPGIGLGHRRLAIIDLATGDQPMFNRARSIALVFNGEIYNFRELRRELIDRGHRFDTASDTEVIIHAWEEWKENCVERLTGMFAFVLWDAPGRTLFLARDRLGEKPLYYALLPDGAFIFGSELKALLVHPGVSRRIDPSAVEDFFALGYVPEPRTIYENVLKLPSGHALKVTRGAQPQLHQYWKPRQISGGGRQIDQLADELIDLLGNAVKSQLVSDVPVGAFLSGGVDSSGTAALMAKAEYGPIHCFTIGFGDPRFDETKYASAVAERYSAEHIIRRMKGDETQFVPALARIFDEPFGDSSALPSFFLMQLARQHVKVALSGDGGDELFAGYRRYVFHQREENLRRILPPAIRRSIFAGLSEVYPRMDWAPRILRARHTLRELSADSAMGYFRNVSVTEDDERAALFTAGFRRSLQGYHSSEVVSRHWSQACDDDPVAVAQYVDLKTWLPGDILTKVDRTSMAVGLEARAPMLDHRFVEWALSLPRRMKIANGSGKLVLKRAFERLVPREVLYRPKQGFSVPLADWFRGALGAAFQRDLSSDNGLAESGFFDLSVIDRIAGQHQRGLRDNSRLLWLLWNFHRFFIDVHAGSPAETLPMAGQQATSATPL